MVCGKCEADDNVIPVMQHGCNDKAANVSDSNAQAGREKQDEPVYKPGQASWEQEASNNNAVHLIENENKPERLRNLGVEVLAVNEEGGHVSIAEALKALGERGINSILVEGGAHINGAFIDASKVNCIHAYIGAKIFGGGALKSPIIGTGFESLDTALTLGIPKVEIFGEDVLLSYDVK